MGVEIASLKQALGRDVYRPNLFQVQIVGANAFQDAQKFQFLCKGATIPQSQLGTVALNARGRVLQLPGDRTFEDWTVTVYNDDSWLIRNYFEKWQSKVNQFQQNISETFENSISTALVTPLARVGTSTVGNGASYKIEDIWPASIGQIALSAEQNQHSEFSVTFKVNGVSLTDGSLA